MRTHEKSLLTLALVTFTFIGFISTMNVARGQPLQAKAHVAYFYSTDLSTATIFQAFLQSFSIQTDLIRNDSITGKDLSAYKVILIGPDTGDSDISNWGNASSIATIKNAPAKILGIGEGGGKLFDQIDLSIGWMAGGLNSGNTTNITTSYSMGFRYPNTIPTGIQQLYTVNTSLLEIYIPSLPSNVTVYGRSSSDPANYGTIASETARFVLFGFNSSTSTMTDLGRKILLNIVMSMYEFRAPLKRIAYIYYNDTATAVSFQTFLEAYNLEVTLFRNDSITPVESVKYDLFIIGPDTGYDYDWGDVTSRSRLMNSPARIIGLQHGGAYFFEMCNLSIGAPHGWTSNTNSTKVTPSFAQAFNQPYVIPDGFQQLYTTNVSCYEIYYPGVIPGNVTVYDNSVWEVYHHAIVQEGKYVLWGFKGAPSLMTDRGKEMFINLVTNMHAPYLAEAKIAFVYTSDIAGANSYQSFLRSYGFETMLVQYEMIQSTDLSRFDLIFIGNDADNYTDWGNASTVDAIKISLANVIGLGNGGAAFFDEIGLSFGYSHGVNRIGNATYIKSTFPAHFQEPFAIPTGVQQVYATNSSTFEANLAMPPASVTLFCVDTESAQDAIVAQDTERFVLWGFNSPPCNMTDLGKKMLINMVMAKLIPHRPEAKIAMIYSDGNIAESVSYWAFLKANGFTMNLIHNGSITGTDLTSYSLLMIGTSNAIFFDSWDNSSSVAAINNSGARILGLGYSGAWFFDRLHLTIGRSWSVMTVGNGTTVLPAFPATYNYPYTIPAGSQQVYSYNTYYSIIYNTTFPVNVTAFCRYTYDPMYFPVIQETSKYLLWGFYDPPQYMTDYGREMFIDLISEAVPRGNLSISHPPDITYEFGTTGHQASWLITDNNTAGTTYTIYRNWTRLETLAWTSDMPASINVDGLAVGTYNYTMIADDGLGNVVVDSVIVTVILPPDSICWICILLIIVAIIGAVTFIAVMATRKKKQEEKRKDIKAPTSKSIGNQEK
nr:hypothetical protein [Candidatus Sigynarchaeota archaeon]